MVTYYDSFLGNSPSPLVHLFIKSQIRALDKHNKCDT